MKEKLFPIEWKGWDIQDTLINSYYDVKFLADFGVFKAGETFSSITVNYGDGIIEAYSENGTEVVKTQHFVATPAEK
jgi:hypothetical protein